MYATCKTCTPAVEITESDKGFAIMMELPGSNRDEIKVWQENSIITISGEKEAQSGNRILNERIFGKFQRTFRLPDNVDREKIEANYSDGVVTVEIAKLEEASRKNIKIN
ncbi:MAG: Hsp20/alpha crystallin family protein [candidate division Zixibacteria bacterium]|nr:Hsp20/alpha crystallin family protein [candidate division Zixibacteria bacterium]